jgi:hypothetical protein
MLTLILSYFAFNFGTLCVVLDMETSITFKQAIKKRGRLFSNAEYVVVALLGGPIYLYTLIKRLYERTKI